VAQSVKISIKSRRMIFSVYLIFFVYTRTSHAYVFAVNRK